MQYLIVEKLSDDTNMVHVGPMNWRPTYFKNALLDDLDIEFNVPLSNDSEECIIVNQSVKIMPVKDIGYTGECNSKIQFLQGPYYNYFEDRAEQYWTIQDKDINVVKSELKTIVAANRYSYEIIGVKLTLQGKEVTALTNRGDRDLYLQAYQMGKDNVNWKFGAEFLTLSNAELGQVVSTVTTHVQNVFDWEAGKVSAIDSSVTLAELDAIELESDNPEWNPPKPFNPMVI
jgi:hypothetical protein